MLRFDDAARLALELTDILRHVHTGFIRRGDQSGNSQNHILFFVRH